MRERQPKATVQLGGLAKDGVPRLGRETATEAGLSAKAAATVTRV